MYCTAGSRKTLKKPSIWLSKAVDKGAELIVFPEVFSTGFCYEHFDHEAETLPSPTLENLACFSEANDCIIMGSIIEKVAYGKKFLATGNPQILKIPLLLAPVIPFFITISDFALNQELLRAVTGKLTPLRMKADIFPGVIQSNPFTLKKRN